MESSTKLTFRLYTYRCKQNFKSSINRLREPQQRTILQELVKEPRLVIKLFKLQMTKEPSFWILRRYKNCLIFLCKRTVSYSTHIPLLEQTSRNIPSHPEDETTVRLGRFQIFENRTKLTFRLYKYRILM